MSFFKITVTNDPVLLTNMLYRLALEFQISIGKLTPRGGILCRLTYSHLSLGRFCGSNPNELRKEWVTTGHRLANCDPPTFGSSKKNIQDNYMQHIWEFGLQLLLYLPIPRSPLTSLSFLQASATETSSSWSLKKRRYFKCYWKLLAPARTRLHCNWELKDSCRKSLSLVNSQCGSITMQKDIMKRAVN